MFIIFHIIEWWSSELSSSHLQTWFSLWTGVTSACVGDCLEKSHISLSELSISCGCLVQQVGSGLANLPPREPPVRQIFRSSTTQTSLIQLDWIQRSSWWVLPRHQGGIILPEFRLWEKSLICSRWSWLFPLLYITNYNLSIIWGITTAKIDRKSAFGWFVGG